MGYACNEGHYGVCIGVMTTFLTAGRVAEDSSSSFMKSPPENLTLSYFASDKEELIDVHDEVEDDESEGENYYTDHDYMNRSWLKNYPYRRGWGPGLYHMPIAQNQQLWPYPVHSYYYPFPGHQNFYQQPGPQMSFSYVNKTEEMLHVNSNIITDSSHLTGLINSTDNRRNMHVYHPGIPIPPNKAYYSVNTSYPHPVGPYLNHSYYNDSITHAELVKPSVMPQTSYFLYPSYVPPASHFPHPPFLPLLPFCRGFPPFFYRPTTATTKSPFTNQLNLTELIKGIKANNCDPIKFYICLKALRELNQVDALVVVTKNHISPTVVCRTLWKLRVAPLLAYDLLNKWMDDLHYKSKIMKLLEVVTLPPPQNTTESDKLLIKDNRLTESQEFRLQTTFGNYTYRQAERMLTPTSASHKLMINRTIINGNHANRTFEGKSERSNISNYLNYSVSNRELRSMKPTVYIVNGTNNIKFSLNRFSKIKTEDPHFEHKISGTYKMQQNAYKDEALLRHLKAAEDEVIKRLPNITVLKKSLNTMNDSQIVNKIQKLERKKFYLHKNHNCRFSEIQCEIRELREKMKDVHKKPQEMVRGLMNSKAIFEQWIKRHPEAYNSLVDQYSIRFKNSMVRDVRKMAKMLTTKRSWSDRAMQRLNKERELLYKEKQKQLQMRNEELGRRRIKIRKQDNRKGRLNSKQLMDIDESERNRILEVKKGKIIQPKKRFPRKNNDDYDYSDYNDDVPRPNWNYEHENRFRYEDDEPSSSGPSDEPESNPGHEMDSDDKPLFKQAYKRTKLYCETEKYTESVEERLKNFKTKKKEKMSSEVKEEKRRELLGQKFITNQEELQKMRERKKYKKKLLKRKKKLQKKLRKKKKKRKG